ncbi:MAG: N-6 DNA methylase [Methanobrevibacter sp.]|nr:N-6 DNA methylase [Methanobrevibacter sp.]
MVDFESSKKQIANLVEEFKANEHYFKSVSFDEENTKINFINKFFIALGWDVYNDAGVAPQYKDVEFEDTVLVSGKPKNPDYSFRVGGTRKFFVEAKAPHVNVENSKEYAFQLKRYTWSGKLSVGLLTDFEELSIYVPKSAPKLSHHPKTDRIKYYKYTDYVENWEEIYNIYSKEAVLSGKFDNYFSDKDIDGRNPTSSVDSEFLKTIEEWRLILARNIALRNKELEVEELNYAVQLIIDRIIFLRIAEDRGIERYGKLKKLLDLAENNIDKCPVYEGFIELCKKADAKYNSGLFHFTEEEDINLDADILTPTLHVDDGTLKKIIKGLYYPDCPYEFSMISTEILGNIYEQFLGKVIRLTDAHHAKVEDKPEVKKAGGVYYTPQYIVNYIVDNTIGELLKGKTPNKVSELKIVDPACGSGSFLLGAYQKLLDWHVDYYSKLDQPPKNVIYTDKKGIVRLTIQEKKRILLNNIYGVDIDSQAVEVTKLSLLLKVLEDENKDVLEAQQKLIQERALPYLGDNIKCGNSLVSTDMLQWEKLSGEEISKLNPFDWEDEFREVFSSGGFDAIVGNPPYVAWSDIEGRLPFESGNYLNLKYKCRPNHDDSQPNLYMFFLIKTLSLVKEFGKISYILPQEWLYQVQDFRNYILKFSGEIDILKFNEDFRVFKSNGSVVGTNSLILTINQNNKNIFSLRNFLELDESKVINFLSNNSFINENYSENASDKLRFLDNRWEFYNDLIEKILSRDSDDYINFKNKNYFKVVGGFQPNVELSKKFILTDLSCLNNYEKEFVFPCIYQSNSFKRYYLENEGLFWVVLNNAFDSENEFKIKCPNLFKILSERLKTNKKKWWEFPNVRNLNIIKEANEKLFSPRTASINSFSYDDQFYVMKGTNSIIVSKIFNIKYVLAILNSSLASYFYKEYGYSYHGSSTKKYEPNNIKNFMIPIKNISDEEQEPFIVLADKMLELNKQLKNIKTPKEKRLIEKQIEYIDKKINQLVYELYDLTGEEIDIVETVLR